MKLGKHDHIVTAFAKSASGPGWSNTPVWVIVQNRATGEMREECLQPEEQSERMWALYKYSQLAHTDMTDAVNRHLRKT